MANKVKFGLRNVYYAPLTVSDAGVPSFGEPVKWPGAVELSMEAQGETGKFYADDGAYFVNTVNNGYEGDLTSAMVPESFRKDILGEFEDGDGVLLDDCDATQKTFALLFEFQGDKNARRHVMYNCTATRPSIGSKTKEESVEVQTEAVTITASPLFFPTVSRTVTKGSIEDPTSATYTGWYTSVHEPSAPQSQGAGE